MAAAGPGLYSEIGKKARGSSSWIWGFRFCHLRLIVSARGLLILFGCCRGAFPRGSADLLYKDYHTDQKFTLTTYAANGAVSFHSPVLVFVISPCYFLALIWHDASRYAFRGGGGV